MDEKDGKDGGSATERRGQDGEERRMDSGRMDGGGWLGDGAPRAKLVGEAMGSGPRHFFARRLVNAGG